MAAKNKDPFDQFMEDCKSIAPEMGALGGVGTGVLATELTANPAVGVVVGTSMTKVAEENWPNVCAMAVIAAEAITASEAPSTDGPSPSADTSVSPSD